MSVSQPNRIAVPLDYWIRLRKSGYQDWYFSFWRELFQNSVDAHAKNVSISLTEGQLSGVFGAKVKTGPSIRVAFADDGVGMSRSVIENVFLVPGLSTKTPELGDIGGFGTARTLLCFSQHRYEIHTRGLVVEGRGSEYILSSADEAMERAKSSGDEEFAERISANRDRDGCVFIIEMDQNESQNSWENPSAYHLENKLKEFCSQSSMKLETITYNGQPIVANLDKGRRKNRLAAPGGEEFASLYVTEGARSRFNNRVLVRVNGLCMTSIYTNYADGMQVIIEIDPKKALDVLTDNRDSMKSKYSDALWDFVRLLSENRRSALRDSKNDRGVLYRGSLGSMRSFPLSFKGDSMKCESVSSIAGVSDSSVDLLAGFHDVYIEMQYPPSNKVLDSARRRNIPTYWRFSGQELAGRGRRSHEILAAWSGAVQYALEVLVYHFPSLLNGDKSIAFVPGFIFVEDGTQGLKKTLEDGRHAILVNPVRNDGFLAYDLNRLMDGDGKYGLQRLMMIAIHEVAHVFESSHNNSYANVLTDLHAHIDYREMAKRVLSYVNEARSFYGLGPVSWESIDILLGRSAPHVERVVQPRENVPAKVEEQVDMVSVDDVASSRNGEATPSLEDVSGVDVPSDDMDLGLVPLDRPSEVGAYDILTVLKRAPTVGDNNNASNDMSKELDMDLGSLRI